MHNLFSIVVFEFFFIYHKPPLNWHRGSAKCMRVCWLQFRLCSSHSLDGTWHIHNVRAAKTPITTVHSGSGSSSTSGSCKTFSVQFTRPLFTARAHSTHTKRQARNRSTSNRLKWSMLSTTSTIPLCMLLLLLCRQHVHIVRRTDRYVLAYNSVLYV